jgi:hypothetical protein
MATPTSGGMSANLRTVTQMCRLTRHYSVLPATFVSCNTEGIFSLNLVHRSFIFTSLQLEIVQRTLDLLHPLVRDVRVPLRRLNAAMPQQFLNVPNVHAILKQMRRKPCPERSRRGMAQGMKGSPPTSRLPLDECGLEPFRLLLPYPIRGSPPAQRQTPTSLLDGKPVSVSQMHLLLTQSPDMPDIGSPGRKEVIDARGTSIVP